MRVSATRPNRLTRMAIETLSIESRFTAERSGTGSSPGSSTTSLASPRTVVVHGATSARRCRGMTASRDRTTTGRRPISAISHHHTSPRAGTAVTTLRPRVGTKPGPPTRLVRRADARRRRRNSHLPRRSGNEPAERQEPHRRAQRPSSPTSPFGHPREATRPPLCSDVCESCHNHATHPRRPEAVRSVGDRRAARSSGSCARDVTSGVPAAAAAAGPRMAAAFRNRLLRAVSRLREDD